MLRGLLAQGCFLPGPTASPQVRWGPRRLLRAAGIQAATLPAGSRGRCPPRRRGPAGAEAAADVLSPETAAVYQEKPQLKNANGRSRGSAVPRRSLCPVGLSCQAWLGGARLLAPDPDQAAPQLYFSLFFSYLSGFFVVVLVFLKNVGCEATAGKREGM